MNEKHTAVNVSFGVIAAAVAFAPSAASSESSSSSTVHCPDGTTVTVSDNATATANAEATAIAATLGNIEGQTFEISGDNVSFAEFQQDFNQDVAQVESELVAAAKNAAAASANTSANTSTNLSAECGTPPPPPPPPTVTPPTPGIAIEKAFVASFNPDGTLYSTLATKHGDIDQWQITVENTGGDTLSDVYTDTPPEGEVNINDTTAVPAQPFGFQVDGNGIGSWLDTLNAGAEQTYFVYTENNDVPCFTNVVDTVEVVGTDMNGNQVTAQAQAFTKEENTGPDCINTPPPVTGPGQPLPSS